MPVAALSSICDPTASVLPSPLSAMEKPNWAPSRGFDALTYAICLHVEVVLDFDADARAARPPRCGPPSAARPATAVASRKRQTLRLVTTELPAAACSRRRAWARLVRLARVVAFVDLLAAGVD